MYSDLLTNYCTYCVFVCTVCVLTYWTAIERWFMEPSGHVQVHVQMAHTISLSSRKPTPEYRYTVHVHVHVHVRVHVVCTHVRST